jgi:N6-L-threonylcarbamoyladenine synthase
MKTITILGIESSCDETAAAIYQTNTGILSNTVFSSVRLHAKWGGVIPEIASRSHFKIIEFIVDTALQEAKITLADLDGIAVTTKPGLPGSLLIGLCFAKALAYAQQKKIIGINHLEGHIFSPFLENPTIPFPHISFTASGGHTSMYRVDNFGQYTCIDTTSDDAAGEALDKTAFVLGIPYPGGPALEKFAHEVHFQDFFHYPRLKEPAAHMSFSGLKTAILYDLVNRSAYDMKKKLLLDASITLKHQVASSLHVCLGDIFIKRIERAFKNNPDCQALTFAGGVSCNEYFKYRLRFWADKHQLLFYAPSKKYASDNAAMIAFVGHYKAQHNQYDDMKLDIG